MAQDGNRTAALTCDAAQDELFMGAGVLAVTQILTGQLLGTGGDIDLSGLRYDIVSEGGGEAQVRVHGDMRVAVLGLSQSEELDSTVRLLREGDEWRVCEDA